MLDPIPIGTNRQNRHLYRYPLRERLTELQLDWADSPLPPRDEVNPPRPLRITVDSGDVVARLDAQSRGRQAAEHAKSAREHERAGRWKQAIAELDQAITLNPADALSHNNLAWYLATCPDHELRDIPRSVELAGRAVELVPNESAYRNTLGVCLYRAGDSRRAVEELTKSEEVAPDKYLGHNAFFLSLSYWQLGEPEPARAWLRRAIEWLEKNATTLSPPDSAELDDFRAEAELLVRE